MPLPNTLAGTILAHNYPEGISLEEGKPVMTVKLYAFTCGTVTGEFAHLMEGGEGLLPSRASGLHRLHNSQCAADKKRSYL